MDELTAVGAVVATEVIKNLAKDMASFLKEKVTGYYQDATNKELVDSGWAFEDYLRKTYDKYSVSKSILYTNKARKLESFYVPMDLTPVVALPIRRLDVFFEENRISSDDIRNVMSKESKILITGTGGIGKTMIMKYFCMNAIDNSYKIPVFISLRWFNNIDNTDELIERFIYSKMAALGFNLEYEYFKYSLEGDKYVFLLDGFDEMSVTNRLRFVDKFESFVWKYSKNSYVVSSRQIDEIVALEEFEVLKLCPMTHKQSVQLIWKLDFDYGLRRRFISEINTKAYSKYKEFISVPLLLSILFLTYNENTIIPETLQDFYEKAFDTMLYQHDRLKAGFERQFKSGLDYAEFRIFFLDFCFRTYFHEEYAFGDNMLINRISKSMAKTNIKGDSYKIKEDLLDITCMLIRDGNEYVFIHRSFQEYFAASYVSKCIEEQQCQLCATYIRLFSFECKFDETDKVGKNFLNMLRHIEPVRFEYVVLQPIRAKLFNACQSDIELLEVISNIFGFGLVNIINGRVVLEWFIDYNSQQQHISGDEMRVLVYFHGIAEKTVIISDSLIDSFIITNTEEIIRLFSIKPIQRDRTIVSGSFSFLAEGHSADEAFLYACRGMLRLILTEIERYKILQQKSNTNGRIDDIIDSM